MILNQSRSALTRDPQFSYQTMDEAQVNQVIRKNNDLLLKKISDLIAT